MVQKNLFAGQEERQRHRELACGHGGRGRRGWDESEGDIDIYMLPGVKQTTVGY